MVFFLYHISAQTERISIQFIFSEKGEEALMKMSKSAVTSVATVEMHKGEQKRDFGAGHHITVHFCKSTTEYTHTQLFAF